MLTRYSEFYLRKDFGFIDLGIPAVLSPATVAVYEAIRRYVWRGKTKDPVLGELIRAGKLPARVSQNTIAVLTGMGRTSVWGKISDLKKLGWLDTSPDANGRNGTEVVYVLGERVQDSQGGYHEVFYADSICLEVWRLVEEKARKRFEDRLKTSPEGLDWVMEVPAEERVEMTGEAFGEVVKKMNGGCSDSEWGVFRNRMGQL